MLRVADFIGKTRSSVEESALATKLRALPEEQAFEFILEYTDYEPVVALTMANRCLKRREYFELLLKKGFEVADASSIQFWLDACGPRIGAHRVLRLLRQLGMEKPNALRKFLYRARDYILRSAPEMHAQIADLATMVGE